MFLNNLFASIREGIKLKRMEDSKPNEVEKNGHRVAMDLVKDGENNYEFKNDQGTNEFHFKIQKF